MDLIAPKWFVEGGQRLVRVEVGVSDDHRLLRLEQIERELVVVTPLSEKRDPRVWIVKVTELVSCGMIKDDEKN